MVGMRCSSTSMRNKWTGLLPKLLRRIFMSVHAALNRQRSAVAKTGRGPHVEADLHTSEDLQGETQCLCGCVMRQIWWMVYDALECCASCFGTVTLMWSFVLCCAVLCCAVLCCAVLCCAVLHCAVLCCGVPCRAVLCRAGLCCAVLRGVCCAVQCHAMPCCRALPHFAPLCPGQPSSLACCALPCLCLLCQANLHASDL